MASDHSTLDRAADRGSRHLLTDWRVAGSAAVLIAFAVYFAWDIVTLRQALDHPDIYTYYYSYRQWVSGLLAKGEFPLWNPYWGLGHPVEVWSSIPVDLYSLLDIFVGPYYHVYLLAQLVALLLVVWWVCRRLGFDPALCAAGAILFFMSPLVTYWYFSFLITNVYVAHVLLFFLLWAWFQTGQRRYVFLVALTVWLSMVGTKIEFWFYQTCYFLFLAGCLAVIVDETALRRRIAHVTMAWGAIALGILCNAWQLTILLPAVAQSGRVPDVGASVLVNRQFYRDLAISFTSSGLWQLLALALMVYFGVAAYRRFLGKRPVAFRHAVVGGSIVAAVIVGASVYRTLSYHPLGDPNPLGQWEASSDGAELPRNFVLTRRGECGPPSRQGDSVLRLPEVTTGDCFLRSAILSGPEAARKLVRVRFELRSVGASSSGVTVDLQDGKSPVLLQTFTAGSEWHGFTLETVTAIDAGVVYLTVDTKANTGPVEIRNLRYESRTLPAFLQKYLGQRAEGLQILQRARALRLWIGLVAAFAFVLFVERARHAQELLFWPVLLVPLVDYFARPLPGNLGEMDLMARVPGAFPITVVFLGALGLRHVGKARLATVALMSLFFVSIMREQGQVVLAYLAGVLWIPTRDNYIIDFALTVLCLFGMADVARPLGGILRSPNAAAVVTAAVVVGLVVVPATGRLYNVQALMHKAPPDYPYYGGVPALKPVFAQMASTPRARVYLANYDAWGFTFGFGNALLQGVDQITMYDSLTERVYKDWTMFGNLGIRPEARWDGYVGGYTPQTIATLPKKNTLGMTNDTYYHYTVIARPPIRGDLLHLIGVSYVLKIQPITGDALAEGFDPQELEQSIAALNPVSVTPVEGVAFPGVPAHHYLAKIGGSLPRAYVLPGVDADAQRALALELAPKITPNAIEFDGRKFRVIPAEITRYEREDVHIHATLAEPGILVLSDLFHPFWTATVDGAPAVISPAFGMLRAVHVPGGDHDVEFTYRVPGLRTAAMISAVAVLLLMGAAIFDRRRRGF